MTEEIIEEIEIDNVSVPDDDTGDLINVLFRAGFSDEETDIILEAVFDMSARPEGEFELDEEIIKITDAFSDRGVDLNEDDLSVIRTELQKRFA